MFRHPNRLASLCRAWLAAFAVSGGVAVADDSTSADGTEAYLRETGLNRLHIHYLEREISSKLLVQEKRAVAQRLAAVLLEMAAESTDPEDLHALRSRVEKLAREHGFDAVLSEEMLLRTVAAEFTVLKEMFGQSMRRESAAQAKQELLQQFEELSAGLRLLIASIESGERDARKEVGSSAAQSPGARHAADRRSERLLEAQSMMGWALVARAWLTRDSPVTGESPHVLARQAMPFLGEVLGVDEGCDDASEASVDLRKYLQYSDAMLAVALGKSLAPGWQDAEPWFDLLSSDGSHPSVRESIDVWRMAAMLGSGAVAAAERFISRVHEGGADNGDALAVALLPRSLGQSSAETSVAALATSMLAANSQWSLMAKTRSPAVKIQDQFADALLEVAHAWRTSRSATADTAGATRREVVLAVQRASFDHASTHTELRDQARAAAEELSGWCLWELGEPARAANCFAFAKDHGSTEVASRSAAMEIECLAKQGAPASVLQTLRLRLIDADGSSESKVKALLDFASQDGSAPERVIAALLALEPSHPQRDAALRAASRVIYQQFRESTGEERSAQAARLLRLAAPAPSRWPAGSIDEVVRRQLDAALDDAVIDLPAAHELLDEVAFRGPITDDAVSDEMSFRREQLALAESRWDEAVAQRELIGSKSEYRSAADALLRRAVMGAIRAGESGELPATALKAVAHMVKRDAEVESGTERLATARTLLELASAGQVDCATVAMTLVGKSVVDSPTATYEELRLLADAALAGHDEEASRASLSRLVNALDPASAEGARARLELCEVLLRLEPAVAGDLLRQQRVLVPGYGPDPWGPRLQELAARVLQSEGNR